MAPITFSGQELGKLWLDAGGKLTDADTASAIALAFSAGCRFTKHGPRDDRPVKTCGYMFTTGVNRYGLWGINPAHHPRFTIAELYTADGNARAAVEAVGLVSDFSAFPEFTSGAFRRFLRPGALPAGTIPVVTQPGRVARPAPAPVAIGGGALAAWSTFSRILARGLPAHLASSRGYRALTARQITRLARPPLR